MQIVPDLESSDESSSPDPGRRCPGRSRPRTPGADVVSDAEPGRADRGAEGDGGRDRDRGDGQLRGGLATALRGAWARRRGARRGRGEEGRRGYEGDEEADRLGQ